MEFIKGEGLHISIDYNKVLERLGKKWYGA